jgi:hypothetical protein
VAQYVSYTLSDTLTLNGRGEIYRDDNNFFVASFQNNGSFVTTEQGLTAGVGALHATTYGELTVGVTYKPSGLPPVISGLLIRPEVRWDTDLGGTGAFNRSSPTSHGDNSQVTLASDFVLTF